MFDKEKKQNKINKSKEDCLTIGYDYSKERDHTALIISRPLGNGAFEMLNEFYDKEAEEIYNKLIGGNK